MITQKQLEQAIESQSIYQPVQFVYTETIGANKSQTKQFNNHYQHLYRDILIPHIVSHYNPVFYILFHTPSIYNWLRNVPNQEAKLLNSYIKTQEKDKSVNNRSNISTVRLDLIQNSLGDYIKKWEVVKLGFCCKIYVLNTHNEQKGQHLTKTQTYSNHLSYNPIKKQLICTKARCKILKQDLNVTAQIRQYPHYLLLKNCSQLTINISKNKLVYHLLMMFSQNSVFVKAANKIWYEINLKNETSKPIGINNINMKTIKMSVYAQEIKEQMPLKIAKSLNLSFESQKIIHKDQQKQSQNFTQNQRKQQKNKIQQEFKQENPKQKIQITKKLSQEKVPNAIKSSKLKSLRFEANKVIMGEENRSSQTYIKNVNELYTKQKIKDEYQLDYDKGKLKKRKQKITYIQPNYNQVHAMVKQAYKQGNLVTKDEKSRKIKKRHRQRERQKNNQREQ